MNAAINTSLKQARPRSAQNLGSPRQAPSGDVVQLSKGNAAPAPQKASWTILVYAAADNNLLPNETQNLVDAQKVGSTSNLSVVSQFDQGGTVGSSRYYITKSADPTLTSPVLQQQGTVNMADPNTLSDFIQWGEKAYPADHYMVIINDHGDGWRGAVEDDSSGGAFMSLPQIQQGVQAAQDATGNKLDILGFDACLMANAEVVDQLKNNCNFMVGSQETEGTNGWPYTQVLNSTMLTELNHRLRMRVGTDPKSFAQAIVKDATAVQGDLPTLSAFDMSQVPTLMGAIKGLGDAIKAGPTPSTVLKPLADGSQQFYDTTDLYDFADHLSQSPDISDAAVKQAAQTLKQAISSTVIAEQHSTTSYPNAHGVTVNLSTYGAPGADYRGLVMPQETGWDGVLDKLAS